MQSRPLCIYGSKTIPAGAVSSTSISRCVAQAIVTIALRDSAPAIYVTREMPEMCCPGGLAHLGYSPFNPGIKYFVSTGSKEYRAGQAEFLRTTPELFERNRRTMGEITPLDRYTVIQPCDDVTDEDPGVRSILCFGTADQVRNLISLIHFRSQDPFHNTLAPQGAARASFVSYAAGIVENCPPDSAIFGPSDPTGNRWFPENYLSLA
ncbi:MAG TPA: DUF169 domain-containing protein, partial [Candidatus Acidoferrales bacterium]|nr:DUF169 domain-containing protein [Candidatus Acidoferrales bacterium]